MNRAAELAVLALQSFIVAFLLLHDWVPLGRLNDLKAVRTIDSLWKRILLTLISAMPFLFGLSFSFFYVNSPRYPGWVRNWLWASYGILFAGEIRAWWLPYLWRPEPALAARYRNIFGNTHTFLPERNGISPNTLHVILHVATLALLLLFSML